MTGANDPDRARLRAELLALGRGMEVPEPEGGGLTMAERVLAQIVAEAVPVPVPVPPGRLERARGGPVGGPVCWPRHSRGSWSCWC